VEGVLGFAVPERPVLGTEWRSNPGDPQAEQRFKMVNEAYDCLSDPVKRIKYESSLRRSPESSSGGSSGTAEDPRWGDMQASHNCWRETHTKIWCGPTPFHIISTLRALHPLCYFLHTGAGSTQERGGDAEAHGGR
jgi:curved DNA-binding protein CbpA